MKSDIVRQSREFMKTCETRDSLNVLFLNQSQLESLIGHHANQIDEARVKYDDIDDKELILKEESPNITSLMISMFGSVLLFSGLTAFNFFEFARFMRFDKQNEREEASK